MVAVVVAMHYYYWNCLNYYSLFDQLTLAVVGVVVDDVVVVDDEVVVVDY